MVFSAEPAAAPAGSGLPWPAVGRIDDASCAGSRRSGRIGPVMSFPTRRLVDLRSPRSVDLSSAFSLLEAEYFPLNSSRARCIARRRLSRSSIFSSWRVERLTSTFVVLDQGVNILHVALTLSQIYGRCLRHFIRMFHLVPTPPVPVWTHFLLPNTAGVDQRFASHGAEVHLLEIVVVDQEQDGVRTGNGQVQIVQTRRWKDC